MLRIMKFFLNTDQSIKETYFSICEILSSSNAASSVLGMLLFSSPGSLDSDDSGFILVSKAAFLNVVKK